MAVEPPKLVPWRAFTEAEHEVWRMLFDNQAQSRAELAVPEFSLGLEALGITRQRIPDLDEVNARLSHLTGWKAVSVEGLEDSQSFYAMMARKEYPIGCFIREAKDLSYTPAPDVFHDLYGHMPFFIDPEYALFCEEFGKRTCRYLEDPKLLLEWERLFWFTIEFGLIESDMGRKIFGGGLLSSFSESLYALSDRPLVYPFDLNLIRNQDYRVDIFQEVLFLLPNRRAVFDCLDEYEAKLLLSSSNATYAGDTAHRLLAP